MRQTNRVEPINNNNSDQAIVITTLELDINRQVEVTPIVRKKQFSFLRLNN